jgi:hypothetical protein
LLCAGYWFLVAGTLLTDRNLTFRPLFSHPALARLPFFA